MPSRMVPGIVHNDITQLDIVTWRHLANAAREGDVLRWRRQCAGQTSSTCQARFLVYNLGSPWLWTCTDIGRSGQRIQLCPDRAFENTPHKACGLKAGRQSGSITKKHALSPTHVRGSFQHRNLTWPHTLKEARQLGGGSCAPLLCTPSGAWGPKSKEAPWYDHLTLKCQTHTLRITSEVNVEVTRHGANTSDLRDLVPLGVWPRHASAKGWPLSIQ